MESEWSFVVFPNLSSLTQEIQVGERKVTLGARLHGSYSRDTYHTGQTDLLRQVAGTNDKII